MTEHTKVIVVCEEVNRVHWSCGYSVLPSLCGYMLVNQLFCVPNTDRQVLTVVNSLIVGFLLLVVLVQVYSLHLVFDAIFSCV